MKKRLRHGLILGIIVIATLAGLNIGGSSASAKVKLYKSVPTALRGSWYPAGNKSTVAYKFTKYTLKQPGQTLSMKAKDINKRLGIYKTKAGYYAIGLASGDMPMRLKPVKHNGKKALRNFWVDFSNHDKKNYNYYYQK